MTDEEVRYKAAVLSSTDMVAKYMISTAVQEIVIRHVNGERPMEEAAEEIKGVVKRVTELLDGIAEKLMTERKLSSQ